MTDIEKLALALVNEQRHLDLPPLRAIEDAKPAELWGALSSAASLLNAEREAHAATKREVSDAVEERFNHNAPVYGCLSRFIIKPPVDPVRLILESVCFNVEDRDVEKAKAALAARGGRIVFDGGE